MNLFVSDIRKQVNMQRRPDRFNTKRKILPATEINDQLCKELARKVKYGGNPEHKRNPGDFKLTPPSLPRPAKSLCDTVNISSRKTALKYLRKGLKVGLVSVRTKNEWPQNIWSLTDKGEPLEAQLENANMGTYHGYPMPSSDPFSVEIIKVWNRRNETA
jgi:threonine dehydrogenase-like Zn-dependent dehydrogenase